MKSVSTPYWNGPNTAATNESGFSVLPGGSRSNDGSFNNTRSFGAFFWSATEGGLNAWYRVLTSNVGDVYRINSSKSLGASVRCLKN
jgi:uncharacterized protein (TIGR02145 family)